MSGGRRSVLTRWRVAARLARREVRRHWARSLLVVVIIALPVLATQAVAIGYRAVEIPPPTNGRTLVPEPRLAGADEMTGFDPRLGRPPAIVGAERVETGFSIDDWTARTGGRGDDDLMGITVVGFVPDASEVPLAEGRLPATRREVVVTQDLAEGAGLAVGDRFEVIASRVELEVVGISTAETDLSPTAWAGPVADGEDWVPEALVRIRDSGSDWVSAEMFDLYWLPARGPLDAAARPILPDDAGPGVEAVVIGAAGGAIAVGFVATICSAAFAIGARRQLRQLGTLAAVGAGPADLARAVLLQGTTLGLLGGAVATVLVYGGREVVVRRMLDDAEWSVGRAPDLVLGVVLLGVVAGTLAALVPALTASRIPTLSALAGRRPTRRRRLRSPYAGIVLLVVGLGMLSWASGAGASRAGTGQGAVAAVGVLLTMAGGVALSPAIVAGLSRLCGRAKGTVRLSGRSIARDGMRSAAIVATTAVAVALPVVVLVWGARDLGDGRLSAQRRADDARLAAAAEAVGTVDVGDGDPASGAASVADQVRRTLGHDETVAVRQIVGGEGGVGAVDPDELERVTGDEAVADALRDGGLVHLSRALDPGGSYGDVDPASLGADGRSVRLVAPEDVSDLTLLALGRYGPRSLVSVGSLPDDAPVGSWTVLRPRPLTDAEVRQVQDLGHDADRTPTRAELRDLGRDPGRLAGVSVYVDRPHDGADPPWGLIVFAASVLVALAVIGVASALAAADGRPDDQVVAAVGAPPAVVRRRRVLEATFTAAGATVLGGGLGAVATLVVIHSPFVSEDGVPPVFRFPVLAVAGVALGTVAVVGGATWLILSLAAAVRGRRDLFLVDG